MASQPTRASLERKLVTARGRRDKAEAAAAAARAALRDLYPAAREAGIPITRIHELTGLSRTVLHRLERQRRS